MAQGAAPLRRLAEKFARIPGIGRKTAQRMAYYIISLPAEESKAIADTILEACANIHRCAVCCDYTEGELCAVCDDDRRDKGVICVVEQPQDLLAIERTREYNGTYHVLHGAISPLDGIGPEQITVKELLARVAQDGVREVIMATDSDTEGETTAMYLSKLIKPFGVKVTRLAYGIPVGSDLQYADEVTLSRAIEGRRDM
ncbi:MAG: recombination protein RecR [Clostridia bacterium]|nr:recombination protein RecR [Clostridia bacterium]